MQTVNIIVMGKTGTGKSTLINAVLNEDRAPTGIGRAVTLENQTYEKIMKLSTREYSEGQYGWVLCKLLLYDTVGLEIDPLLTEKTLKKVKEHIQETRKSLYSDDYSMVWFCVSAINKRFEEYETELIRKLSIEYEIPFIIVLTQSISKKKGDLELYIEEKLPDIPLIKVLAKSYPIDDELSVPPMGIDDLLSRSIRDYQGQKVKILENKLNYLHNNRIERLIRIREKCLICIDEKASDAMKIGLLPAACIPFVHGICISMIAELNDIAGINGDMALAANIFTNVILGVIATPFMAIPLLSAGVAKVYVESVGDRYFNALMSVINNSTDEDLRNTALMERRISEELRRLKN